MRCPNCEQWNRASLPRCTRCGFPLEADTPVEPSWRAAMKSGDKVKAYIRVDEDGQADVSPDRRDELAAQMTELKARKEEGDQFLQQLKEGRTGAIPVQEAELEDGSPSNPFSAASSSPAGQRRSARVSIHGVPSAVTGSNETVSPGPQAADDFRSVPPAPGQWQDNRGYDPMVEEMQKQNVFRNAPQIGTQNMPRTRSRRRRTRRFFNFVTVLLCVVVLVLAGSLGYVAYQRYQASRAEDGGAIVTASMKDDQAAHTILIPGEEGQMIYIRELHSSYEVINGFATVVIPDHQWYDDMSVVNQATMSVTLTPSVQTSGARQKAIEPITYEIDIPLSPIELVSPSQNYTETTSPLTAITLNVRPGSTVTVNGENMSDAVKEDGQFIYNAKVQAKGNNVFTINVRSPYCRDNSVTVTVYREPQEIPLDLDVTTYTSTSLNKYQITCTTMRGAEIDILSPHSDLVVTDLGTSGMFSFYAIFEKIGDNTVSIQASYDGLKPSRVDYVIYYVPNVDDYTRQAWSLSKESDYSELVGNISVRAEKQQIYVAMGVIDSFVSESPQRALVYCSEDGKSHPVIVENRTKTEWKAGQYYRIYADVYGSYNGMPWLVARYCYID